MRDPGTPAARAAATTSCANPSGPQTYTSRSGEVGHEPGQRRTERDLLTRPHQLVHATPEAPHVAGDLVAQEEILAPEARSDRDDVGVARQVVQQGADRRDAHAGADEQHAVTPTGIGGERAVRPLDGDARPRRDPGQAGAVIAQRLHGDAQGPAVRDVGEGVRVRLPPQPSAQEPPLQELPAGHREAVEVAALHDDGERSRPLGHHVDDAQAVAQPSARSAARRGSRRRARASRSTAPSTTSWPGDGRRRTRPCRPGGRTRGRARGTCRDAPPTTSRRRGAGARSGTR